MASNVRLPEGFVLDAVPSLPDGFVIDQPSNEGGIGQTLGNIAAGAIRGAGSIGATIISPYDIYQDYKAGKGLSLEANRQRRAAIDAGLESLGADPESLAYKGGKIAGEIAGTAGAGGVLGNVAAKVGLHPAVGLALKTGGFKTGIAPTTAGEALANLGLRAGAGAATGGAQAAIANPEDAGLGAAIGGAIPISTKVAGEIGKAAKNLTGNTAAHFLGASTGAGADAVKVAFESGKQGAREFLDNMRGNADFSDIVEKAKGAVEKMARARSAEYRSGFVNISNDKSVLPISNIEKSIQDIGKYASYKGKKISTVADDIYQELSNRVDEWKKLNPADYHTPEGFDALKKYIGELRDKTQPRTAARAMVEKVYNEVHSTITNQAPVYAKVMRDYHQANNAIKEIEKTLSLGEKAATDTAVRKLQSIMRNNAQTSYGNRIKLVQKLEKNGANISAAIAGQSMSSITPRGMTGAIEKAAVMPATVYASLTNPGALLPMVAAAPLTSPRAVGEAAYALGRATGKAGEAVKNVTKNAPRLTAKQKNALSAASASSPLFILLNRETQQ